MAITTIKIKVSFAWWWKLYFHSVVTTYAVMGIEPDMGKVVAMAKKALRTEVL